MKINYLTVRNYIRRFIRKFKGNLGKHQITPLVRKQNKKLARMINATDDFYKGWIENKPEGKTHVSFRGNIVITTELGSHLWQRVEIRTYKKEENAKELLLKLRDEIGIKQFVDEDGCCGVFSKKNDREGRWYEDTAYCYMNPYFKDGYFENHTLETGFIELK